MITLALHGNKSHSVPVLRWMILSSDKTCSRSSSSPQLLPFIGFIRERGSDTRRRAPGQDLSPGPPHRGQSLCTCDGHTKRRSKFMDIFCCCSSSASSLHTAASCFLNAPVLHPTHNILSMPAQSFNTDIDLILLRGRTIMCRHSVFAPFFFFLQIRKAE